MRLATLLPVLGASLAVAQKLASDLSFIKHRWGQITPYHDNAATHFGVEIPGLPTGCQVEQVSILQRHAQRFATSADDDGGNDLRFAAKLSKFKAKNQKSKFTGLLDFLNSWKIFIDDSGLLTAPGANTEFEAGTQAWNRYGRILYNAKQAQLAYNPKDTNGFPKPVLRTTNQSRIVNSEINWALGFFGTSWQEIPNPELKGVTDSFNVVYIPEGGTATENNTLASYDSCLNDDVAAIGSIGDDILLNSLNKYLGPATARLNKNAPSGFKFTVEDAYAMQSLCAYESAYLGLGASAFCYLFTQEEWESFEYTLDLLYYYDYSYGQPTGRAQGIGYVQELLARLEKHYIKKSDSSVNSTLDNNGKTFPLDEAIYADFSHDDIIISTLTALSFDYLHDDLPVSQFPPNPHRKFILSNLTPFGARLATEVIGCASADPKPLPADQANRIQYYQTQYGYNPHDAPHKFIRMRLNSGYLPLKDIRGGACDNGRPDGMCAMDDFLKSQADSFKLSQYQYACFGKYKVTDRLSGKDYDGAPPPKPKK